MQTEKIVFFITLIICSLHLHAQRAPSEQKMDGYKLVWSDEFNHDGLPDTTNWHFENGFVRNEEAQWYEQGNAWCENGKLIIEGRRERKPNPDYLPGSNDWRKQRKDIEYTSSSINTLGKHSWHTAASLCVQKLISVTVCGLPGGRWALMANGHPTAKLTSWNIIPKNYWLILHAELIYLLRLNGFPKPGRLIR
jgi:hypothetical protein